MAKKITVIGGSGFVGTNLCRQLSLKQQDFEIIDLKMSNQFPEKCKIAEEADDERRTKKKAKPGIVINSTRAVEVRIQAVLAPDNSVVSAYPTFGIIPITTRINNIYILFNKLFIL